MSRKVGDQDTQIPETEKSDAKGKPKKIKKIFGLIASVLVIIVLVKAFRGDFDKAASELTNGAYGAGDATDSGKGSNSIDEYISEVKNGYLGEFTDLSINDMFTGWYGVYYDELVWDGGLNDENEILIDFQAKGGGISDAHIQFKISDKNKDIFRVSYYDDGTGKQFEATEIAAELNNIYYVVSLKSDSESDNWEEELSVLVGRFDQINGCAVLYGASKDYSGNRSKIGEDFFEETPIDMSVSDIMNYYYDNIFTTVPRNTDTATDVTDNESNSDTTSDFRNIDFSKYMGIYEGLYTSIAFSPATSDDYEGYEVGSINLTDEASGASQNYTVYYNTESTDFDGWNYEFLLCCDVNGDRIYFGFYEADGTYYIDYNSEDRNLDMCIFVSGFGDVG